MENEILTKLYYRRHICLYTAEWAASGVGVLYVATFVLYYFLDRQPRWLQRMAALLFSNVSMSYGALTISMYEEAGERLSIPPVRVYVISTQTTTYRPCLSNITYTFRGGSSFFQTRGIGQVRYSS